MRASLGRKAHCASGAACSLSVEPLLALAASFCWIRPLRFSAAKARWGREHLRHGVAARCGRGDPHRGGGGSPPCCGRRTLGSRAQLARVPVAPAQALSLGQNRWYEHAGAAAAHPPFGGQASLFSLFACEALRTLLIALLDIPVPLALECSCVARGRSVTRRVH